MAQTVTSSNTPRRYPPACRLPGWKRPSEGTKRRYEAHFLSKLTDCDGEQRRRHVAVLDGRSAAWAAGLNLRVEQIHQSNETDSSLDFARDCEYISIEEHAELTEMNRSVGRMLGSMLKNPAPFLLK